MNGLRVRYDFTQDDIKTLSKMLIEYPKYVNESLIREDMIKLLVDKNRDLFKQGSFVEDERILEVYFNDRKYELITAENIGVFTLYICNDDDFLEDLSISTCYGSSKIEINGKYLDRIFEDEDYHEDVAFYLDEEQFLIYYQLLQKLFDKARRDCEEIVKKNEHNS